ncbi:MAG: hypothetical protein HXY40_17800 [Chloroflexi bacterium]|nr:hypothetical protein [Chloroflexota bacterium]
MTGRYSPNFRKKETDFVLGCWRKSESCSLVGVGSSGKSNLLRHLTAAPFKRAEKDDSLFRAVMIDPKMLSPIVVSEAPEAIRCWAGYELMIHHLYMAFYPFEMFSPQEIDSLNNSYQAFQDTKNPLYAYISVRHFEFALSLFMRHDVQIVFMFDEFEEMLKHLPVRFFLTLRGMRDAYKRQLSFLTFTRAPLPDLIAAYNIDTLHIEPFSEIFTDNQVFVGLYEEADARAMVKDVLHRYGKQVPDAAAQFLLWASGGHAGLLRTGAKVLDTLDLSLLQNQPDDALKLFAAKEALRAENTILWHSLSAPERRLLKTLSVANPKVDLEAADTKATFELLLNKGLLIVHNRRVLLHPPVFQQYVAALGG